MLPSNAHNEVPRHRSRPSTAATADAPRATRQSTLDGLGQRLFQALARASVEGHLELSHTDIRRMVDGLRPVILQLPYAAKRPPTRRQRACSYVLTDREKRMLIGVAMGHQSAEIGAMLGISPQTVKTYLGNAYAALGARNAAHAVAIALRIGILTTADITAQG